MSKNRNQVKPKEQESVSLYDGEGLFIYQAHIDGMITEHRARSMAKLQEKLNKVDPGHVIDKARLQVV